jgi:hypothetical protein
MRSKFSFWCYFVAFYSALFFCILIAVIPITLYFKLQPYIFFIIIFLCAAFVNAWLISGEMRQKVVTIEIGYDNLILRRYLGLGKAKTIYFDQLDGFRICYLPTNSGYYEYLYVISGNRKVLKLSQFYHRNYFDLKQALSEKLKNLGEEDFSYKNEFKEIFS